MKRRTLALVVLGAVVLSSLATWFASSRIRSPADLAARKSPPAASLILVPVEKRVLATTIVSRALSNSPAGLRGSGAFIGPVVTARYPFVQPPPLLQSPLLS